VSEMLSMLPPRLSQVRALLSEIFKKDMLKLLIGLPLGVLLFQAINSYLNWEEIAHFVEAFLRIVSFFLFLHMAVRLAYFQYSEKSGSAGFPMHAMMLPLQTWFLVCVPVLGVWGFASVYTSFWFKYIVPLPIDNVALMVLGLAVGIFTIWVNAITWSVGQARILAMLILLSIMLLLASCIFLAVIDSPLFNGVSNQFLAGLLLCVMFVGGYGLCHMSVLRARSGEVFLGVSFGAVGSQLHKRLSKLLLARKRISANYAQFYYEWLVFGWLFPAQSFLLGLVACVIQLVPVPDADKTGASIILVLTYLFILPLFGFNMGGSNIDSSNTQMGLFWSTRPLSDKQIALSKLRMVGFSIFIGFVVFICLFYLSWLIGSGENKIHTLYLFFVEHQGHFKSIVILLIAFTAMVSICWSIAANLLSVALRGGESVAQNVKAGREVFITLVFIASFIIYKNDELRKLVFNAVPLLMFVPFVVGAGLLFFQMDKYKKSAMKIDIVKPLVIILSAVIVFICLLASLGLGRGDNVLLSGIISTLAVFSLLPCVSSPIAVYLNRHR